MDLSSWNGTLSAHDFCHSALAFAEKWKRVNPALPPWSWIPLPYLHWTAACKGGGYLSLEKLCFLRPAKEEDDAVSYTVKEAPNCSDADEANDDAMLVQSYDLEVHYYDLHIVYSASYKVPVLYFHAYYSDGQSLVLDDIEKDLPTNSAKVLLESKWTFITQEEHPYLNRPWFTLHPCGTSEWMKLLFCSDTILNRGAAAVEQYLVSWLSVVGQVINLKIPLEIVEELKEP